MNIIYLLLPLALLLVLVFVIFYLWAVKRDQFEDLETPARRILLDEQPPSTSDSTEKRSDR